MVTMSQVDWTSQALDLTASTGYVKTKYVHVLYDAPDKGICQRIRKLVRCN